MLAAAANLLRAFHVIADCWLAGARKLSDSGIGIDAGDGESSHGRVDGAKHLSGRWILYSPEDMGDGKCIAILNPGACANIDDDVVAGGVGHQPVNGRRRRSSDGGESRCFLIEAGGDV